MTGARAVASISPCSTSSGPRSVAWTPSTQRALKLSVAAASSVIDWSSASAVTGSITLSSRKLPVWLNAMVASLPTTRATTIVRLSTMTGFTLPGMMLDPGWVSGRASSAIPARGPIPISRRSEAIFHRLRAMVRIAPCAAMAASSVAWAWKWFEVSRTSRPVSADSRAQARPAYSGWALMPVPTAVPPSGTSSSSAWAARARRIDAST